MAGPFPRYEARMVWLLPLMATLMGFAVAGRAREDAPRLSFAPA